ncbi:MBOAT family protein [Desulfovibrio sp. PG-178-WT-4]|mgnify:CR=1 FL=1|uniref:MBOAT family protein n=1 Tax=Desulfovibrio porci TaxID=2605782 RepID=A0A6L5XJ30_9BACT|nr:MBOAT family protein [Desulfovibrio porci]MDY3809283.1 MBOAT family protein [Desulfovibrio porci]MSS27118.1 MBOAT family protein [Desulfovibrio porci]
MLFTSFIFLFIFFPIVFCCYCITKKQWQNFFLLSASLLFYAWGESAHVVILIFSIIINYAIGIIVEKLHSSDSLSARFALVLGILANIFCLGYYKYVTFIVRSAIDALGIFGITCSPPSTAIPLPIGISFFTFKGLAYLIDIYRKQFSAQKNIIDFGMYLAFFPQLLAGPIARYQDFKKEISNRSVTLNNVALGLRLFSFGMAKKVLIANSVGTIADAVFALPAGSASLPLGWLGVTAYTLQIYFDFSGYSDMAIGIGLMFGFHTCQNFNYPYIADSLTNFWRRWHISLSTWFRDYLYIPLGGNRHGSARTYRNLLIVFLATGLWHGASWAFVAWGLWHGIFLILERRFSNTYRKLPAVTRHGYSLLVIMLGWVLFRSNTFAEAANFTVALFDWSHMMPEPLFYELANMRSLFFVGAGCIFSMPVLEWFRDRVTHSWLYESLFSLGGMAMSIVFLANSTYTPFLYFRF